MGNVHSRFSVEISDAIFLHRPVADWAKSGGVKQFLFISSAGIYKATEEPPHVEGVWSMFIPSNILGTKKDLTNLSQLSS